MSGPPCRLRDSTACVLNLGTELAMGVTVNTNGSWLARRLTLLGFTVKRIVVVRDEEGEAVGELRRMLSECALVVTTGGLGPTHDDMTARFVALAAGRELEVSAEALEMVREAHAKRGEELTEARAKQALMPRGAVPIRNDVGTAPGFYLCLEGGAMVVSLPGPPREMQPMFERSVEPLLRGPPVCTTTRRS